MYFPKEEMDSSRSVILLYPYNIIIFILFQDSNNTIAVLGKGTVGKTSLIFRYINNRCPKEHDPTVEDSYVVQITTSEGKNKEFKILDTAGEEDYQNMLDKWINDAKGFILVFAINDSESFEDIKLKFKRIEKNDMNNLPIILVGNKCDLSDKRTISEQQGKDLAKTIGGKYYETSALNDINGNVKVVFTQCAKMISECSHLNEGGKPKCVMCSIF